MNDVGLHGRHRNRNGEISRKHGNTLVRTLRTIYGPGFAAGERPDETLSDILATMDEPSLTQLVRDHQRGELERRIGMADAEAATAPPSVRGH